MHRREFIKLVATAGIGFMSARVLRPVSALAAELDTVDITLEAKPFLLRPNASVGFHGLAYNKQSPGPLLRVRYGQRFRARFINHTGTDSTVHWHGMILPNRMDGVPNVTQVPVPDGGEFIYEFKPDPPGFRWYHSRVDPQLPLGLFGAFIVEDPKDEPADVEVVLILHDVPKMHSFYQAVAGVSSASMVAPLGAPELAGMKMMGNSKPPRSRNRVCRV